jgi:hypothetical protein
LAPVITSVYSSITFHCTVEHSIGWLNEVFNWWETSLIEWGVFIFKQQWGVSGLVRWSESTH